jgi:DNA-binding transcriptional LysR family regulator
VDLKLLEDLVALSQERSFVRAAELRHVTHPAFGRRIRALEAWAGAALVDRTRNPLQLTEAGLALLQQGQTVLDSLNQTRAQLRARQGAMGGQVLRIASGRTLARTLVMDWIGDLTRPRQPLHGQRVEVATGSMAQVVTMIERGDVDFVCCYEHPATSVRLSGQRFRHVTMMQDKLVPVCSANARAVALHDFAGGPLVAYAGSLSLGALLQDHLRRNVPNAGTRIRYVSDSPDVIQEFVLKGLAIGWLPWSMVAGDCRSGTLLALGSRSDEVHFDVRLYRARARQSPLVEAVWAAVDK